MWSKPKASPDGADEGAQGPPRWQDSGRIIALGGCTRRARGVPGDEFLVTEVEQGCPGLGLRVTPAGRAGGRGGRIRAGGGWPAGQATTPRGQSHVPGPRARDTLLPPGPSRWASALAPHCSGGSFPRGGVNLAGGSGEGVLQLELGSPAPGVGSTFPAAIHRAPSFAIPAPSPASTPPPGSPTHRQHQSTVSHPASPRRPKQRRYGAQCVARALLLPLNPALPGAGRTQSLWDPDATDLPWAWDPPPPRAEQSQLLCSDAGGTLAPVFRYPGPDADEGVNPGL